VVPVGSVAVAVLFTAERRRRRVQNARDVRVEHGRLKIFPAFLNIFLEFELPPLSIFFATIVFIQI